MWSSLPATKLWPLLLSGVKARVPDRLYHLCKIYTCKMFAFFETYMYKIISVCRFFSRKQRQKEITMNHLLPPASVFIRPVAHVGSGDPVRVLRLYTTITLDEVCSIYCWDICTTCRYRSTCYSTCASGPTALSVCSWLCLVANCAAKNWVLSPRTVLYNAFYSYLCRRYWNGILGPSTPVTA